MRLEDLASLMNKTKEELEEILKHNEVIELKLNDKTNKETKDIGGIEILNKNG